jgi:hypothetical protein
LTIDEKLCWRKIFGAQVEQVGEHHSFACSPFIFEMEEFPESRALSRPELDALYRRLSNFYEVAELVGASEAFVRHTIQKKSYKHARAQKPSRTGTKDLN